MDLRERKTRRSITNAFLQLRKNKPLERITVKELSEMAEISKATFYLHYQDIYDLSRQLQEETIQSVLTGICNPHYYLTDVKAFTAELVQGFYAQQSLIDILFSGNQEAVLPMRIEKELRHFLRGILPEEGPQTDMLLTYQILGSIFVYQEYHKTCDVEEVIRFLGDISEATMAVRKDK